MGLTSVLYLKKLLLKISLDLAAAGVSVGGLLHTLCWCQQHPQHSARLSSSLFRICTKSCVYLAGYKVLALLDVPDKSQEKADLYIHVTYIKKWDICAGNAILKALGGTLTTLSGEEISYTGSDGIEGGSWPASG